MTKNEQETRARRIIERLKMFNRKERDHLMKFALCEEPEAPRISNELWKKISNGGTRPNADRMFLGMDYHLNWLYAALATAGVPDTELNAERPNEWSDAPGDPIRQNQEDVDLLIAWFDRRWSKPFRLVLLEAKLDSSWISRQLESKRKRLQLIREEAESLGLDFMDWQLLLVSPRSESECGFEIPGISCEYYTPQGWEAVLNNRARVERVSGNHDRWVIRR